MRYNTKKIKEYNVQGFYQGWEDLTASDNWKEAKADLKSYHENERGAFRIITRLVENPDYLPNALTKKQADQMFRQEYLPNLDQTDRPAVRFAWSCFIDDLQKSRKITAEQAANWSQPVFVSK